jgi:hypothetical protein
MVVYINYNEHVIKIVDRGRGYFDIFIDGHRLTIRPSFVVFTSIIKPLENGTLGDDIIECLKLIASTYRDECVRTKYVNALACMGSNIKKWIGKSPHLYLRCKADLVHITPSSEKYLLAFLCKNGWFVVNMSSLAVYAYYRDDDKTSFSLFTCDLEGPFDIILAELLPALKEDLRNIQYLRYYGFDGGDSPKLVSRMIKSLLNNIPKEWWKPLDIESLILEYALRQLG